MIRTPIDTSLETLQPVHLSAESLWSRYGFGDGDPFEFADRGPAFDDQPHPPLQAAITALDAAARGDLVETLVRTHLLPEIARITGETPTLARVGTQHNQVRDARFRHDPSAMPEAYADIAVTVTPTHVADALVRPAA